MWLVGAHLLEAIVPVGETGHALGIEQPQQTLAKRAGGDFTQRCLARKNIGQIEHLEFLDAHRAELGIRRSQHLHRAELQRLELFLVLVERRVMVDVDFDLTVGVFLAEFLELLRSLALGRVGRDNVAEF
jgi:hypothetical protein